MSKVGTVETKLLELAAAEGATKSLGPVEHEDLSTSGAFPAIYTIGWIKEGAVSDDGTTEAVLYSGAVVFVFDTTLESARAAAEALDAAVAADRTLGALVGSAFASVDSYSEAGAGEGRVRHVAVVAVAASASATSGAGATTLLRWSVVAAVLLRTSTVAEWHAAMALAIAGALGGSRLDSDVGEPPVDTIPNGALRWALEVVVAPTVHGSNLTPTLLTAELRVYRRLTADEAERDYTTTAMWSQMLAVGAREFWLASLADAEIFGDGPELGSLERIT